MSITTLFPRLTRTYLLAFQFSSWYPKFSQISIKSSVVRPLSGEFRAYLDSDGVFAPRTAEDELPPEGSASDDDESSPDTEGQGPEYAFPELDAQIRKCVAEYGAVFPKLNFSSPRDAAWILPASSPLRCTTPRDVYLLLKSSDYVAHDLDIEAVFDGCCDDAVTSSGSPPPAYEWELVLRKWYAVRRSRELRCFVRQGTLLAISQRDPNYYEFWNEPATRENVPITVQRFWETKIKEQWDQGEDYTVDVLLTRDLSSAHIVDFNPYAPRTDPLLFTYEELHALLAEDRAQRLPVLKVIDSRAHPAATRNAPMHQHNMVPLEALSLSTGKGMEEFAEVFKDEIKKSME